MTVFRKTGSRQLFVWLAAVLAAPCVARAELYTQGHGDVNVRYFHAGDGSPDALQFTLGVDPGAIVNGEPLTVNEYFMPSTAASVAPLSVKVADVLNPTDGTNWSDPLDVPESLGLAQGDRFWNLMQNRTLANSTQSPFLGTNASAVDDGLFVDDGMGLALVGMQGPDGGQFSLWHSERGIAWDSLDGLTAEDAFVQTALTGHSHWNFAFSKPGDYLLTMRAFGTLVADGVYLETERTYLFHVVPEPSSVVLAGLGLGVMVGTRLARRRRAKK